MSTLVAGMLRPDTQSVTFADTAIAAECKGHAKRSPILQAYGLGSETHSASAAYKPPLPSGARASRQGCSRIRRPSGVRQGSSPYEHALEGL